MLTEKQQYLINILSGDTWLEATRFAKNVQHQGWCSAKQETTVLNMYYSISRRKSRTCYRKRSNFWGSLDHDELTHFTGWQGEDSY